MDDLNILTTRGNIFAHFYIREINIFIREINDKSFSRYVRVRARAHVFVCAGVFRVSNMEHSDIFASDYLRIRVAQLPCLSTFESA